MVKKTEWKKTLKFIAIILFFAAITLAYVGFHSLDIAWNMNMAKINSLHLNQVNIWEVDLNILGVLNNSVSIYLNSWKVIFAAIILIFISFSIFIYILEFE